VKVQDPCGCFPTGRHYPGIAHLIKVRAVGVVTDFDASTEWVTLPVAFIDTETTGRDSAVDRLVEVGIVLGQGGEITARHSWLINPQMAIPEESSKIHGITDADVADKPIFADVVEEILKTLQGAIPAAYNASFDRSFLFAEVERTGVRVESPPPAVRREVDWIDPLTFARELYKQAQSRALGEMAALLGISMERAHRATDDAEAALRVLYEFAKDTRVPRSYAALIQEQRRLSRMQEEARRFWRRN